MFIKWIQMYGLTLLLGACAHRGAVRVDCEGPLRSINQPSPQEPPVSISPAPRASSPHDEKQP
jgi:hypothetical protein